MKKTISTLALAVALTASGLANAATPTLKMTCGPTNQDRKYCNYVVERFEKETGAQLETVEWPFSSTDQLSLLQQMFAAQEGTIDVMQVDVVWPGLLGKHLMDLTPYFNNDDNRFFEASWKNNIVEGKLKAVPAFIDAAMLYTRTDLLEKYNAKLPTTWAELEQTAQIIQAGERKNGKKNFWGFVFQGKAYEGLSCDAIEWVTSFNGGNVVEADGTISINNANAAKALDTAAGWVGTIAPKGVLGYTEEESRALFQNGDALFMRNWPYAWANAQADDSPVKGKISISVLPKGGEEGRHSAALGGWQFGVNNYSENKELAVKLVAILTDEETQKARFKLIGNTPSLKSLYDDPEVLAFAPYAQDFLPVFDTAVARPSTATKSAYNKVSKAFYNASFNVLSGRATGEQAVAKLEKDLKRIKGRGW